MVKGKKKSSKKYKKVSDVKRKNLIHLVFSEGYLIKDASSKLKINYSTAKTILRVFRNENRYERKYEYSGISIDELYTDESYFVNDINTNSPIEENPIDIKQEINEDYEENPLKMILNLILDYEIESTKNMFDLKKRIEKMIINREKDEEVIVEISNIVKMTTDANTLLLSNARNIIYFLKKLIKN